MTERILPRYPIYIPSRGRYENGLTAKALLRDEVPFHLVVEEHERGQYAREFGNERLLVLPFRGMGSSIFARNWIKQHATEAGHKRHWQLDDNMRGFYRRYKTMRIPCAAGIALRACEDFTDRYENVAISGLGYKMFAPDTNKVKPFHLNDHVYSCTLVLNAIPHKWRLILNEDTDICLQVLADGWCTILVNAFMVDKIRTMVMKGGNTAKLYHSDGRLKMARTLERVWPGVVKVTRRWGRPQHIVNWAKFDTPLKPVEERVMPGEYGMRIAQLSPVKHPRLRALMQEFNAQVPAGEP